MIQINRAKKQDLAAINELINSYGRIPPILPEYLNNRDLALKAVDTETGAIVGFCWGGLMAQNTVIYIDKVVVNPNYTRKKISQTLYKQLLSRALKLGVRLGFGVIKHDQFHDKSAMNALKMAFAADDAPYTYVYGQPEHMVKELIVLEAA